MRHAVRGQVHEEPGTARYALSGAECGDGAGRIGNIAGKIISGSVWWRTMEIWKSCLELRLGS